MSNMEKAAFVFIRDDNGQERERLSAREYSITGNYSSGREFYVAPVEGAPRYFLKRRRKSEDICAWCSPYLLPTLGVAKLVSDSFPDGDPSEAFWVCDYIDQDLERWLRSKTENGSPATTAARRQITLQLLAGICDIDAQNSVHQDIKPRNIMIQEMKIDGKPAVQVKIADFNFAVNLQNPRRIVPPAGTKGYRTPASMDAYGKEGITNIGWDFYSFLLCVYFIFTEEEHFPNGYNSVEEAYQLRRHPQLPPELYEVLQWYMQKLRMTNSTIQRAVLHQAFEELAGLFELREPTGMLRRPAPSLWTVCLGRGGHRLFLQGQGQSFQRVPALIMQGIPPARKGQGQGLFVSKFQKQLFFHDTSSKKTIELPPNDRKRLVEDGPDRSLISYGGSRESCFPWALCQSARSPVRGEGYQENSCIVLRLAVDRMISRPVREAFVKKVAQEIYLLEGQRDYQGRIICEVTYVDDNLEAQTNKWFGQQDARYPSASHYLTAVFDNPSGLFDSPAHNQAFPLGSVLYSWRDCFLRDSPVRYMALILSDVNKWVRYWDPDDDRKRLRWFDYIQIFGRLCEGAVDSSQLNAAEWFSCYLREEAHLVWTDRKTVGLADTAATSTGMDDVPKESELWIDAMRQLLDIGSIR